MDKILEALDMGRYAQYVWPAFGLTFLLMIIEPIMIRLRHKNIIRRLARMHRKEN